MHENLFKKYHEKGAIVGYMCMSGRIILLWILNMHYLLIMLTVIQIM
jgi:hypothetical protein